MIRLLHAIFLALFFLTSTSAATAKVTITHYHNDISGSPMVATDAAGKVVWKESYRPYGQKLRDEPASRDGKNKIGYAGSPFDASTGLSYMGARYYDPVIGRFMGVDPVGFQEGNVHSFNRYAYANNNPYRYIDPDGRQAVELVWNRAFNTNRLIAPANGAPGFELAKQGIVQGYVDGLKLSAEVGMTVSPLGVAAARSARIVEAVGARSLSKAEVFAARKAPELKSIYGWGDGLPGVKAASESLDASRMATIQSSVTRAEVEAMRDMYRANEVLNRGGAVAPARAGYMDSILNHWK